MDKELNQMASDFAGNRELGAGHGWPSWEAQLLEKGFLEGAKWMQERMYSEEDLLSFAHFYFKEEFNSTMQTSKSTDKILQEWFEQFKKK